MWILGSSPAACGKFSQSHRLPGRIRTARRDRVYKRWRRGGWREIQTIVDDEFPRPFDGFLFEVVAKTPVAEHLEKRVVVGVEADVFEVVMFAAGADAFLGVGGAARRVGTFGLAEEDGHELVHAGVGEQEVRRMGRRLEDGTMVCCFDLKKSRNVLADLADWAFRSWSSCRFS